MALFAGSFPGEQYGRGKFTFPGLGSSSVEGVGSWVLAFSSLTLGGNFWKLQAERWKSLGLTTILEMHGATENVRMENSLID